ncbi:DUF2911 domain-containing protein [Acidobacteria bacterium AB60]|nr:DUF2911 domain-containing protein [Acidobacteria bacterium AB60]
MPLYPKGESMQKRVALVIAFTVGLVILTACRGKRESPSAWASCDFGSGKTIKTVYSSPRMKGRKIYGGIVPFGQVWRTGANEATTFVTTSSFIVGGKLIPAGNYTIFTVPTAGTWTLIVNKKTGEWGIPYKYESDELARIDMSTTKLPSPVENFGISYEKSGTGCTMNIDWETTRASVAIAEK